MATYIKPNAIKDASIEGIKIKDGAISSSKIDETVTSKSYVDAQVKTIDDKLTELESEISIINCNRLEGYDYNSTFTLQTAILAVPVSKRYAAKGITYLDESKRIHLALFNANNYASDWEVPNNWILLDKEFIDLVYNRRFFTPISTRGYIDFNSNQKKLIVSNTLYYGVGNSLKSINAG